MKKQHLSNKDIKKLDEDLQEKYNLEFISKKDKVELLEQEDFKIILLNGKPSFFYRNNELIPTLHSLMENNFLKKVAVDMPAVKFMVNGADVMRPGIVEIDDFTKDEVIVIVDEKNHKPLCLGVALFDSVEMKSMQKGKVIKNIHFVGDKLWKLM